MPVPDTVPLTTYEVIVNAILWPAGIHEVENFTESGLVFVCAAVPPETPVVLTHVIFDGN